MVYQSPTPTTYRPPNASPPTFEQPVGGCRYVEGGSATYECKVRGVPAPVVTWTKGGIQISSNNRHKVFYDQHTGQCSLTIYKLIPETEGEYTCTAVNSSGDAILTVIFRKEHQVRYLQNVQQRSVPTQRQVSFQQDQATADGSLAEHIQTFEKELDSFKRDQQSVATPPVGTPSGAHYIKRVEHRVHKTVSQSDQDAEPRVDQRVYRTVSQKDYRTEPQTPVYYNGTDETFKSDTFEYRLLREIEFREAKTKRAQSETETEAEGDGSDASRPPQILQKPRNSKLLEGSDATFQAKVTGNPKPRVTWFKNGQKLRKSQRYNITHKDQVVTLRIRMVLPEDAGHYTMLVENNSGRVACSAQLVIEGVGTTSETKYVNYRKAPSHPQAQAMDSVQRTVTQTDQYEMEDDDVGGKSLKPNFIRVPSNLEVTEGKMIRIDCRVSGRPLPDVMWFRDGQRVTDDSTHKLLVNEAGNQSLLITIASREDAGLYTCIAKNKSGEARFQVHLTVIEKEQVMPPKFVERFQTTKVMVGEPVSLHARAVGMPTPQITWQKDGIQVFSSPERVIQTSEGSGAIFFPKTTTDDSGWYNCVATNSAGSTSTRARLYVEPEAETMSEPWRLNLPKPTKVIVPEGSPPRETIWLRHIEKAQPYIPREEAERIYEKPAFTTHLRDQLQIQEGGRAHFDARLIPIGDPTMTIEWYCNGRPIEASSRAMTTFQFGYVALTLIHVYAEDSGVYTCRAVNQAGEAITTATLRVGAHSDIERSTQHPDSLQAIQHLEDHERYKRHESVEETSTQIPVFIRPLCSQENYTECGYGHLEAQVTPVSDPHMKIEWFFNGKALTASSRVTSVYSFGYVALNIRGLRAEDSGVYMCKASNQLGEAMSTATIHVKVLTGPVTGDLGIPEQGRYIQKVEELEAYQRQAHQVTNEYDTQPTSKPNFKTQLKDQTNIHERRPAHFEARLEPVGDETMQIEWLKDGKIIEASSRISTFFNFGFVSLTIKEVYEKDTGTYTCRAKNKLGQATSSAKLTCISKKGIVSESQHPEGLEKIQHLEDSSRYQRETYEEITVTQRPTFTGPLQGNGNLVEGQRLHFETKLEPLHDSTMTVEWFHNGKPLQQGNRFKTYYEFGYIALDILHVYPEDSGTYAIRAKNSQGETVVSKQVTVTPKSSIDETSMHKITLQKMEKLERPHQEPHYVIDEKSKSKPVFVVPLEDPPKPYKEGSRIHLEGRVEPVNDETMKLQFFFNGKPMPTGNRFKTVDHFGYVAVDICPAYPEDSGEYTIRATNHLGTSHSSACVQVLGTSGVATESLQPESLQRIASLEDHTRHSKAYMEDTQIRQMPTFIKPLHNVDTIEGSNIHMECRLQPVSDPDMKVEWYVNGQPMKSGHRFRPAYDFDYVALDILSVYAEDSGVYTCKASNKLGEAVTSATVHCIAKQQLLLETQHPEGLQKIQHLEDASRYKRDSWVQEEVQVKPRFLTPLNMQENLREEQTAHFECRLEPVTDSNLKVEWFHNGKPVPFGHRYRPIHDFGYVALSILSMVPEDSGTYTCRATNLLGSAEQTTYLSCSGKSSVEFESQHPKGLEKIQALEDHTKYKRHVREEDTTTQAPVFTSALHNIEIKEGQRAHYESRLIPVGDPNLKVEWFCNGKPVKAGSRFVETNSFGFVALDIMQSISEDSGVYTCKASNALGEAVTSGTLNCHEKRSLFLETQHPEGLDAIQHLEEKPHRASFHEDMTTQNPVFTQPMKNLVRMENEKAHFECRLIPVGDATLKVEWFFNGRPLEASNRVMTMNDFGFVALDMAYVKPSDSGTYSCRATNDLGSAVCSATLDVKEKSSLILEPQQPDSLQQIRHLEDTSKYQRTEVVDTKVTQKPHFVTPLTGPNRLMEGQCAHMECRIEPYPDPDLTVEWFLNGQPLQTGHRFRTTYDFGFVTLDILNAYGEDSGEYMVKATNNHGEAVSTLNMVVTSKSGLVLESQQPDSLRQIHQLEDTSRFIKPEKAEVKCTEKPEFVKPLRNLDNLVEGQPAHIDATLIPVNDSTMKVEWFCNGKPIQTGHRFKTTYDFGYVTLDILYCYPEDSGTYMCKATNALGEAVTTCSISTAAKSGIVTDTYNKDGLEKIQQLEYYEVAPAKDVPAPPTKRPVFLTPLNNVEIQEGQSAHLECRLEPVSDPNLKVEWFVNGVEIKAGHRFRTTHDFGYVALDVLYGYPEDSGTYMCQATNELGEAVNSCSVKVNTRKSIYLDTQHPEGLEKIRDLENQPGYQRTEVEEQPKKPPVFTKPLYGNTKLTEGDSAHLECRVEPKYDSELKIEFFHDGKPLPSAARFHITFDFGYVALDISHIYPEDSGNYTCRASNSLGEDITSIDIEVSGKTGVIFDTQQPDSLQKIQELEDESRHLKPEMPEPQTFQRPVFTQPLQNLDNLIEGDAAHLEGRLIPVGDPNLKVEWFFNEKPLVTGTRSTTVHDFGYVALDIQYVRPDDVGVYMCRASNSLGEAVTTAALKIKSKKSIELESVNPEGYAKIQALEEHRGRKPPEAPEKIYEKPVFTATLSGPEELMEGQPAHFECRVIPVGDPDLRYEWYINGIEIPIGARYKMIHDFGLVCLDITSTVTDDSGIYMVKAINPAGEAVCSAPLKVHGREGIMTECQHPEAYRQTQKFEPDDTVRPPDTDEKPQRPPIFTEHLNNWDGLKENETAYLEARVEPIDDDNLRIEWYKNGKPLVLGTRMRQMFDFGHVSLDINGVRPDDSGIYTCRAVNLVGEAISTCTIKVQGYGGILSGSAHPEILPKLKDLETPKSYSRDVPEPEYNQPLFITHLNNLELREGELAHFECQVEPAKDPNLKIEFFHNGKPLPLATRCNVMNDFGKISLDITSVLPNDAGVYTCKASNEKGQAVTTGSLKVHGKGDIFSSTLHPTGEAGLEKIKELDQYSSRYVDYVDVPEDDFPKPVFTIPLEAKFIVAEGYGLHLGAQVEPSADPKLVIEWFFNGKPLGEGSRYGLKHDFGTVTLNITDIWPRDCGVYTCRASNAKGEAFTSTMVDCTSEGTIIEDTLHPEGAKGLEKIQDLEESLHQTTEELVEETGHPPVFTSQFENLTNLTEGEIAHFEASLAPAGDQTMVVEWFYKDKPLKAGHRIRTVHAFGMVVLEILGVTIVDSGEYLCKATNRWGKASITLELECVERSHGQKPKFTTQMKQLVGMKEGESAHFECNLIPVGDPTMIVEWFHNGVPLRDSSRIKTLSDFGFVILDISFVHVEDSGEYVCRARNKYGEDVTRTYLECGGHRKIIYDSMQPDSLSKIIELEGFPTKGTVSAEVTENEAPKFHVPLQPIDRLVEGNSAHFETRLTPVNDPNLKVEWFFNGKPLKHGHRFRMFHDFGIVILDILYCYGEDTGEYVCKATNLLGEDVVRTMLRCKSTKSLIFDSQLPPELAGGQEKIMQLEDAMSRPRRAISQEEEKQAPVFTVPLENLHGLREGENAHFEARLTPTDDPDLQVEWFKNGKPLRHGTRIKIIHDFGFVVLEISPVYPEDSGEYLCRARNVVGEAVTTCNLSCTGKRSIILDTQLPEGMETMDKIARIEGYSSECVKEEWMDTDDTHPPQFLSEPQDLILMENSLAHFECRLIPVGDPSMTVEWFHNGKPLTAGSRVKTISDFGFVILEVAGIMAHDAGIYSCKARNRHGEASVSAKLQVKTRKSIVMEPQLPQDWKSGTQSLQKLEESMYRVPESVSEDEVPRPPKFITQIQNLPNLGEGEPARFECKLEPVDDPTMKVEWFHNGRPLTTGTRVHALNDFGFVVLEIDWLFPRDAGEYVCRATNKWGYDTTKAIVNIITKKNIITESQLPEGMQAEKLRDLEYPPVHEGAREDEPMMPPKFITQIQPLDNLQEGNSAHFECKVEPVADPKLKVEWYHNGKPLISGHRFKTTHDFGFVGLDILYVYPEDSGEYVARAVNELGQDVTKTTLKCSPKTAIQNDTQLPRDKSVGTMKKIEDLEATWVKARPDDDEDSEGKREAPMFILKPEPQKVYEGDWAKFWCRVMGNPKPRVTWIVNGHHIHPGSRYKLSYDGIYHLDIPKTRQYDHGRVECWARNSIGEAYCTTTLDVMPRRDDYRAVLKRSPKPWYDENMTKYQKDRKSCELERVFEERLKPGDTLVDLWHHTEDQDESREHRKTRIERDQHYDKLPIGRYKTDAFYGEGDDQDIRDETQACYLARRYEETLGHEGGVMKPPEPHESKVHGKEIHVTKQRQTQKERAGDSEITRHTTTTETQEQEHKGSVQEKLVKGPLPQTDPPVFTKKVQPCRTFEGHSAKFECVFTGIPYPTVTWYREDFPIQDSQDFKIVSSPCTSILMIKEVYMEDSGVFSVKAENTAGTAKTSANLVVEEKKDEKRTTIPPSFTRTIQDASVLGGQLVRFDARVTGSKPIDVYWLKGGKKVSEDITHKFTQEENTHTLMILEAMPEDYGTYECVAINKAGEARCEAKLYVGTRTLKGQQKPTAADKPEEKQKAPTLVQTLKDTTVTEGSQAWFRGRIMGTPLPTIQWFKGNVPIKQSKYFRAAQEGERVTLHISEAFPEDESVYKCVATNPVGTVNTSAKLKVLQPKETDAAPTLLPLKDQIVPEGAPAKFTTQVGGNPMPSITWIREGREIQKSRDFQITQEGTKCTLSIKKTLREDEGGYTCRAINTSGQTETSAILKVESKQTGPDDPLARKVKRKKKII